MYLTFPQSTKEMKLDVVGLLAVLGKSSMGAHVQPLTTLCASLLPRLLPAPQALLKPARPAGLPTQAGAIVVGVHLGNKVDALSFFANLLHPVTDLPPLSVRGLRITHRRLAHGAVSAVASSEGKSFRGGGSGGADSGRSSGVKHADSMAPSTTTLTGSTKAPMRLTYPATATVLAPVGDLRPALLAPLSMLSIFSTALLLGLVVAAVVEHDSVAVLAICTLSAASSVVCLASHWRPQLAHRTELTDAAATSTTTTTTTTTTTATTANTASSSSLPSSVAPLPAPLPPGDVVVRMRNGAFVVVRCTEAVARELYFGGAAECAYALAAPRHFHALVAAGTLLLMLGVALLGNCRPRMQLALGSAYIGLNALYLGAALLPPRWHWRLDARYCVEPLRAEARLPNYTSALWAAIRCAYESDGADGDGGGDDNVAPEKGDGSGAAVTATAMRMRGTASGGANNQRRGRSVHNGVVDWVQRSDAAPVTPPWNNWVREAEATLLAGNVDWDPVAAWRKLQGDEDAETAGRT